MTKQNEVKEILETLVGKVYPGVTYNRGKILAIHRNIHTAKQQILDLFKKMAHESVPSVECIDSKLPGFIEICAFKDKTHENIDKIFDDWGKND